MDHRIINGTMLVRRDGRFALCKGDLYVTGGRLSFAPPEGADPGGYEIYDASRRLIIPGLINMHTHAYMSIFRNYADDVSFDEWLFRRIMPVEDTLTAEDAYWTSLLSCLEMITTGTTCYLDMHMFEGASCRAALDSGMRAYIGRGLVGSDMNTDGRSRLDQAFREMEMYQSDRLGYVISPHAIYSCAPEMIAQLARLASEKGMLKQIHLSESVGEVADSFKKYRKSPVELLADAGFLDQSAILAHCVQVSDADIELIQASGATVVAVPASNAKLGNGIAPMSKIAKSGINLCLGTDGASSNNTLNLFSEMRMLSFLQKGECRDSAVFPADEVISMVTVNAAEALGRAGELGEIAEGACADLTFIDLDSPSMYPNNGMISSLCYSASGFEVCSVMADGRFLMKERELLTIDRERLYHEIDRIKGKYLYK